jgi:hypothetical protein
MRLGYCVRGVIFLGVSICCYGDPTNQFHAIELTVSAGEKLVEEFYKHLGSDTTATNHPDIFTRDTLGGRGLKKDVEAQKRWEFVLNNKELFLCERYVMANRYPPEDFIRHAGKETRFFVPEGKTFIDGRLSVTLVASLSNNAEGVWKEITFPIVLDEESNSLRIQFENIKINGILIDPYADFERKPTNFYERLGFRKKGKS